MADKKQSEGLSYPSNPLAAMRDLQDLDIPAIEEPGNSTSNPAIQQHDNTDVHTATQQHSPVPTQQRARKAASTTGNTPRPQRTNASTQPPVSASTPQQRGSAAVRQTMLEVLTQPYESDLVKGPTTATTLRIPTEIWERLGMASSITGRTKQDLVSEAVKIHLESIGREEL